MGFYLRARLHFAPIIGGPALLQATISKVKHIISKHYVQVRRTACGGCAGMCCG